MKEFNTTQNRIVCAANRYIENSTDSLLVLGVRHYCPHMNFMLGRLDLVGVKGEQGFVDKFGNFQTREEAWKIAEAADQIVRRVGGDTLNGGRLFSENLY